jgi:hypothetical protein
MRDYLEMKAAPRRSAINKRASYELSESISGCP